MIQNFDMNLFICLSLLQTASGVSSKVMDDYCWIHSTFHIRSEFQGNVGCIIDTVLARRDSLHLAAADTPDTAFYQWVPFTLVFQVRLHCCRFQVVHQYGFHATYPYALHCACTVWMSHQKWKLDRMSRVASTLTTLYYSHDSLFQPLEFITNQTNKLLMMQSAKRHKTTERSFGLSLGFEDEDLGSSPGWWAATAQAGRGNSLNSCLQNLANDGTPNSVQILIKDGKSRGALCNST